jgi:hypothetical protein
LQLRQVSITFTDSSVSRLKEVLNHINYRQARLLTSHMLLGLTISKTSWNFFENTINNIQKDNFLPLTSTSTITNKIRKGTLDVLESVKWDVLSSQKVIKRISCKENFTVFRKRIQHISYVCAMQMTNVEEVERVEFWILR